MMRKSLCIFLLAIILVSCGQVKRELNYVKDAKEVLVAAREVVLENIKDEDGVSIFRDLKLKADYKESRTGRNPRTGTEIKIDAAKAPKFKAGRAFKDAIQ